MPGTAKALAATLLFGIGWAYGSDPQPQLKISNFRDGWGDPLIGYSQPGTDKARQYQNETWSLPGDCKPGTGRIHLSLGWAFAVGENESGEHRIWRTPRYTAQKEIGWTDWGRVLPGFEFCPFSPSHGGVWLVGNRSGRSILARADLEARTASWQESGPLPAEKVSNLRVLENDHVAVETEHESGRSVWYVGEFLGGGKTLSWREEGLEPWAVPAYEDNAKCLFGEIDLGHCALILAFSWAAQSSNVAEPSVRYRISPAEGAPYGPWSATTTQRSVTVGAMGRYFEYQIRFPGGATGRVGDVLVSYISLASGRALQRRGQSGFNTHPGPSGGRQSGTRDRRGRRESTEENPRSQQRDREAASARADNGPGPASGASPASQGKPDANHPAPGESAAAKPFSPLAEPGACMKPSSPATGMEGSSQPENPSETPKACRKAMRQVSAGPRNGAKGQGSSREAVSKAENNAKTVSPPRLPSFTQKSMRRCSSSAATTVEWYQHWVAAASTRWDRQDACPTGCRSATEHPKSRPCKFWVKLRKPGEIQSGLKIKGLSTPPDPSAILGRSNFHVFETVPAASPWPSFSGRSGLDSLTNTRPGPPSPPTDAQTETSAHNRDSLRKAPRPQGLAGRPMPSSTNRATGFEKLPGSCYQAHREARFQLPWRTFGSAAGFGWMALTAMILLLMRHWKRHLRKRAIRAGDAHDDLIAKDRLISMLGLLPGPYGRYPLHLLHQRRCQRALDLHPVAYPGASGFAASEGGELLKPLRTGGLLPSRERPGGMTSAAFQGDHALYLIDEAGQVYRSEIASGSLRTPRRVGVSPIPCDNPRLAVTSKAVFLLAPVEGYDCSSLFGTPLGSYGVIDRWRVIHPPRQSSPPVQIWAEEDHLLLLAEESRGQALYTAEAKERAVIGQWKHVVDLPARTRAESAAIKGGRLFIAARSFDVGVVELAVAPVRRLDSVTHLRTPHGLRGEILLVVDKGWLVLVDGGDYPGSASIHAAILDTNEVISHWVSHRAGWQSVLNSLCGRIVGDTLLVAGRNGSAHSRHAPISCYSAQLTPGLSA